MTSRKHSIKTQALLTAAALLLPLAAQAHKPWLAPSKTVLSVGQWVTVDAAASTVPFVRDHNAMRLDNLAITAPDGRSVAPDNTASGKLRSTFDLQLTQPGTYRIAMLNGGISASWQDNGQTRRYPPRGQPFNTAEFANAVPATATGLKVSQSIGRLETYVTAGKPSVGALKPTGRGLELAPVTAFNDLYVGERATFQLLIDGKPAQGVEVELIADGARYRDAVGEVMLKTDGNGQFSVEWPQPGLYYLSASMTDEKAEKPATERRSSYAGVFEVLSP